MATLQATEMQLIYLDIVAFLGKFLAFLFFVSTVKSLRKKYYATIYMLVKNFIASFVTLCYFWDESLDMFDDVPGNNTKKRKFF